MNTFTHLPQVEVLAKLRSICFPDAVTTFDPTYGRGGFWPTLPTIAGDRESSRSPHVMLDYTAIPLRSASIDLTFFDPPFQPETTSQKISRMDQKFKATRSVGALKENIQLGLCECARVSRLGVIIKVQDYIHNHQPVWMSMWLWEVLGEPYEYVNVVRPCPKIMASNWSRQLSVYRNHSTFWVYRWGKRLR